VITTSWSLCCFGILSDYIATPSYELADPLQHKTNNESTMSSPASKRLKTDEDDSSKDDAAAPPKQDLVAAASLKPPEAGADAASNKPEKGALQQAAATTNTEPIIPRQPRKINTKVAWKVYNDVCLCRVVRGAEPRSKVAAFDLDDSE